MTWWLPLILWLLTFFTGLMSGFGFALWQHRAALKQELWKRRQDYYTNVVSGLWDSIAQPIARNYYKRVSGNDPKDDDPVLQEMIAAAARDAGLRLLMTDEALTEYNRRMEEWLMVALSVSEGETVEGILHRGIDGNAIAAIDEIGRIFRLDQKIGELGPCDTPR